jgi:hypothetical protein
MLQTICVQRVIRMADDMHFSLIHVRFSDEGFTGDLMLVPALRKELLGWNQTARIARNDRRHGIAAAASCAQTI